MVLNNVYFSYQGCVIRVHNSEYDINLIPRSINFVGELVKISDQNGSTYEIPFEQIKTAETFAAFKTRILSQFNECNSLGS